jgi:hypothetical protein
MAVISVNQFSGVSPMTPPRYLDNNTAQTALNCPVWMGSLQPIRGISAITPSPITKSGDITSIYRFDQAETDEKKNWFHWTTDVDVVQGFIAGDVTERTYYTGDGNPKVTNNALALSGGGTDYPIASYDIGVPKPTGTFTTAKTGTPDANTTAETRVYTFTYVNSWDEESTPYAETDMTPSTEDVYPGESVVVTMPTGALSNVNVTKKRIYRSATGTTNTNYFFVAEVSLATATYTDSLDGDELNEVLPSLTWVQPPTTLKGLVGMANGVMVGFSGNDVYFSEPFRPFAWPVQYMQTVGWPVVGLGIIDTTVVVLTKGRPYFIQGSHPDSMVMIEADINQACLSKRSIVSMGANVFYASPDGLVGLAPGGSAVVTQSMFDKYTWQALSPEDMVGCMYEDKYIGFFDATTGNGGFVYDMVAKTWNFHNIYVTGAFNDLKNDALYVIKESDTELWKWDTGTALSYTWKSKKFTFPEPKSFSCYRVLAEAYPVTMKIYRDAASIVSLSVTDDALRRLPPGAGTDWEFQLEGNTEVYNVQIAQSPTELNAG